MSWFLIISVHFHRFCHSPHLFQSSATSSFRPFLSIWTAALLLYFSTSMVLSHYQLLSSFSPVNYLSVYPLFPYLVFFPTVPWIPLRTHVLTLPYVFISYSFHILSLQSLFPPVYFYNFFIISVLNQFVVNFTFCHYIWQSPFFIYPSIHHLSSPFCPPLHHCLICFLLSKLYLFSPFLSFLSLLLWLYSSVSLPMFIHT